MVHLLAYPRSGSSLVRYIFSILSESKAIQPDGKSEFDELLSKYYKREPFFIKYHSEREFNLQQKDSKDFLILLLRNPIENILSFIISKNNIERKKSKKPFNNDFLANQVNNIVSKQLNEFRDGLNFYSNNIKVYNDWKHDKQILNYENLIQNPKEEIYKFKDVFNFNEETFDEFIKKWDYHREEILKFKMKPKWGLNVNTRGESLTKFTSLLSDKNFEILNDILKQNEYYEYFNYTGKR